jgi:hypothetical protein
MIDELEKTANAVNRLMSNFRVCSNSLEDILMAHYKKQAEQVKEELGECQETATSVYRIVCCILMNCETSCYSIITHSWS